MGKVEKSFWLVVFVLIFEVSFALLFVSSDWIQWCKEKESQWIESLYGEVPAKQINEKTKQLYREFVVEPKVKSKIYEYFNEKEAYLVPQAGLQKIHRWSWPWLLDRIDTFMMMLWWLLRRFWLFLTWMGVGLPAMMIAVAHGYWERRLAQTNFTFSSPILRLVSWKLTCTMVGLSIVSFILPFPLPPALVPVIVIGVAGLLGISLGNVAKRF